MGPSFNPKARVARIVGALALVALVPLACSPAAVSASADAGDSGIESACDNYAFLRCTHLQDCSATIMQMRYGSFGVCKANTKTNCVNLLEAPSTGSTIDHINACGAATDGWACSVYVYNENPPPACELASGPLSNGSVCSVPAQCQSTYCDFPAGSACGTCAPAPKAGDPCPNGQCGIGLVCKGDPPTCSSYAELGAPCSTTQLCLDGLNCVGPNGAGTCMAGVQSLGAACFIDGAGCDLSKGLGCAAATGTCVVEKLVPGGQGCGIVQDQPQTCLSGLCVHGECVSYLEVDEACAVGGPALCVGAARCIANVDGGTSGVCRLNGSAACRKP